MSNAWFRRGASLLILGVGFLGITAWGPGPGPSARHRFNLFAGFLGRQNANRWDCGLDNGGHVCVDPNGSTTVGGGFWPKGTPDQYVFGSGLQVSGIVDPSLTSFPWHGDTSAAFFEDPSGTHENGQRLSLIWNSLNPSDLLNWPRDAYVRDTALYDPGLIGLKAASQQDTWQQYWDGDPQNNAGRPHALGILVDQRGLAWNFPSGNEDIIYFIYTFTNITAKDPTVYAGQPNADSLASLGARFQALNEASAGFDIPDGGYTIKNAYAAFAMDADVSDQAKQNFTTAFIPFSMGIAFKSNWFAPSFLYPSSIFIPPFAPTVGEVGVKYLKSPVNPATGQEVGLTMYSGTVNGGAFGDAANAAQVYRYHSATLNPSLGDAPCNYPGDPAVTHVCYIPSTPDDIRFFQSSGPFDLPPGKSFTIVVAYIASAPVDNPVLAARSNAYIFPVGGPFPVQPTALAAGTDTLRTVDHIFGATGIVGDTGGAPGGGPNGKIDQNEVTVVPRSLLGKGLTAQAVFDSKFLLPFPPDPPDFFLVPGNNQVTVVWRPSPSEQVPDPYFKVASNPTSKLYDPNYRPLDVEGYRIYRGRTTGDLTLIAQFDYAGTSYVDYTAELNYGNCAPEFAVMTDCPADLATGHAVPIVDPLVQIPPGGRVELSSGNILILQADTAGSSAGGAPNPFKLQDTGVPFAYVDNGVKNGFTYFYSVASFDVNSVKSTGVGFTSLEGRAPTKTVVPRPGSGQEAGGGGTTAILSASGTPLDPTAPLPTLDKTTGEFSGPMPPTDGLGAGFALDVSQLITNATVDMQIDSIVPGNGDPDGLGTQAPTIYFITLQRAAPQTAVQIQVPVQTDATDATESGQVFAPLVAAADNAKTARFKGTDTASFALSAGAAVNIPGTWRLTSFGRASINDDPADAAFNGPRWWAGAANENTPNPNDSVCAPSRGACVKGNMTLNGNGDHNAGSIAGVSIFHLQAYSTIRSTPYRDLEAILSTVTRAADFQVYWGATANGSTAIDSVIDVTHKTPVPFKPLVRASWGILDDSSFAGLDPTQTMDGNNALLTWTDVGCVDPAPSAFISFNTGNFVCSVSAPLRNRVHLSPISMTSSSDVATATAVATGNGFVFYLNGHYFLMQTASLPTAGTVWNARFYSGNITGSAGSYTFAPATNRPPAVPGLRAKGQFTGTTFDSTHTTAAALARIHTVPDPYYVTNAFEVSTNDKVLKFVNLPSECIIRIYSLSGILVQAIPFHDATGGGETQWNLRNRNNQFVASGVYFYHVETPDGKSKVGRFTIINFAQ